MNKKGNIQVIILIGFFLFIALLIGVIMVSGSAVLNYVFDIASPELRDLGVIEQTNLTEIGEIVVPPLHSLVENLTWLTGVLYVIGLVVILGFAFAMKVAPSKWLMGFYILMMIILIIGAIFISNIYEDFYDDSGELTTRLREHVILSWMILYSPLIMSIIGFIAGIIMFTGMNEDTI